MSGSLLAPRWLALHAATVSVMVAFGLLGWWQLESYRSSEEQVAQERARAKQTAAAVPLRGLLPLGSRVTDDLAGRAVTVTGRYDPAAQVVVPGRRLDGRTGLGVVTPLRTSDGSVVVVDRGWTAEPAAAGAGVPADDVTVTGVLQRNDRDTGRRASAGTGAGAGIREIAAVSTPELLRVLPYPPDRVYDGHVLLVAQDPAPAGGPTPVPPRVDTDGVSAWRNLSYGVQWWLFAVAAGFLWWSFVRGRARRGEAGSSAASPEPAAQER